jgi:opacity protein-like surface antigen
MYKVNPDSSVSAMRIAIRNLGAALAMSMVLAAFSFAQYEPPPKYEFRLTLGLSLPGGASSSQYRDEWTQDLLSKVIDQGTITPSAPAAFSCQGFAARFLTEHLGIQAGLGIYSESVSNTSEFSLSYTWKSGQSGSKSGTWAGTGQLKSIPLSLNALYEWRGPTWSFFVSAGPTLFFNSYEAQSTSGFGVSYSATVLVFIPPNWVETSTQTVDALLVPLAVPAQSWVGFGFDIGAGVDFRIAEKWAITADIRYFKCPARDLAWTWAPGDYSGMIGNLTDWPFTAVNAVYAAQHTTPTTVRASSLRIAFGVKMAI